MQLKIIKPPHKMEQIHKIQLKIQHKIQIKILIKNQNKKQPKIIKMILAHYLEMHNKNFKIV